MALWLLRSPEGSIDQKLVAQQHVAHADVSQLERYSNYVAPVSVLRCGSPVISEQVTELMGGAQEAASSVMPTYEMLCAGLGGELRPVNQVERRAIEAAKLGFTTIIVSAANAPAAKGAQASCSMTALLTHSPQECQCAPCMAHGPGFRCTDAPERRRLIALHCRAPGGAAHCALPGHHSCSGGRAGDQHWREGARCGCGRERGGITGVILRTQHA